jgi:hypothetical protein
MSKARWWVVVTLACTWLAACGAGSSDVSDGALDRREAPERGDLGSEGGGDTDDIATAFDAPAAADGVDAVSSDGSDDATDTAGSDGSAGVAGSGADGGSSNTDGADGTGGVGGAGVACANPIGPNIDIVATALSGKFQAERGRQRCGSRSSISSSERAPPPGS